jgi:hypothetical protein
MQNRDTSVTELCKEIGIGPVTLYRYVSPDGQLREYGPAVGQPLLVVEGPRRGLTNTLICRRILVAGARFERAAFRL